MRHLEKKPGLSVLATGWASETPGPGRRCPSRERQRRPAGGRGALGGVVSDAVDGCAGDGVPEPGGFEAGAGELVVSLN